MDDDEQRRVTIASYEAIACDYARATAASTGDDTTAGLHRLAAVVPEGGVVLELGSGPGWDADVLEALGPRVRRTDVVRAFAAVQAERGHTVDLLDAVTDAYTDDEHPSYDAVMALCVLLHVDRASTAGVLESVAAALRPGGAFLVSVREGDGELWERGESGNDYHVTLWRRPAFEDALRAAGLEPVWSATSAHGDETWTTVLALAEGDVRTIRLGEVEIHAEAYGDPADPTLLLIHGAQASKLWWPAELCVRLAAGGRHVLRYDQRDTGLSTSWPVGEPGYAMSDLAADAVGVLDAWGVDRAHVVGRSMGGGVALFLGVDHAARVETVTLVTTGTGEDMGDDDAGPADADGPDAPDGPAEPDVDGHDPVEAGVATMRGASGGSPYFDEDEFRRLITRDLARARDAAATLTNHWVMEFDEPRGGGWGELTLPTLVVQGELDPWFPPSAGEQLVSMLPDATLLLLPATGHDVPEAVWDLFVTALLAHTTR